MDGRPREVGERRAGYCNAVFISVKLNIRLLEGRRLPNIGAVSTRQETYAPKGKTSSFFPSLFAVV